MAKSDVSAVTNLLATANEGFTTTLGSTILAGATIVPLASASALTDGTTFVGIIELGGAKQQTFTGVVDKAGLRITSVKWTRGTNADHAQGVSIVDYTTGTAWNMLIKLLTGIFTQAGAFQSGVTIPSPIITAATDAGLITPKVTTGVKDANGNTMLGFTPTGTAVNYIDFQNNIAANPPVLAAKGTDTNIDFSIKTKGTGVLRYNTLYAEFYNEDWTRWITGIVPSSNPSGTWSVFTGSGWYTASWAETGTAQNSELRYRVWLDAGNYDFKYYSRTGQDKGIVTWAILNHQTSSTTTFGSGIDNYVGAGTSQVVTTASSTAVTDPGWYSFTFKTATKNASSSAYVLSVFGIAIIRNS
jgi:hypothetical protein